MMTLTNPSDFTEDQVSTMISGCSMAYTETGAFEYQDMITKLYKSYPSILKAEKDSELEDHEHSIKSSEARTYVAELFFDEIDFSEPILPQLRCMVRGYMEFRSLNWRVEGALEYHEKRMDDLLIASDVVTKLINIPVHLTKLHDELEAYLNEDPKENQYDFSNLEDPAQYFHVLHRVFENDGFGYTKADKKFVYSQCNQCDGDRTFNDSFQCDSCKAKLKVEHEEFWNEDTQKQRDTDSRNEYNATWKRIEAEREAILKEYSQ